MVPIRLTLTLSITLGAPILGCAPAPSAVSPVPGTSGAALPDRDYLVFVAAEAVDRVSLVRFGPAGARVEREIPIGINLLDPDGPHGVAVSPEGTFLYVTTAHGSPYGTLWKLDAATGRVVGRVMLGNFPASLDVSSDGTLAYVVNFNLHGEMTASSVSVVALDEMVEVARLTTCTMPHGSRLSGTRQYSVCMMDDQLIEVDGASLEVARHFMLAAGKEHGMAGMPGTHGAAVGGGSHVRREPACSPTWAQPSPDGARIWVACNKSNEIVEVDARSWSLVRRIPAGDGVYNLAVTPDGRMLLATNRRGQSVSLFDAASGRELARVGTTRPVVHGVAVSPDGRYAFVSVEGIGSMPGTVEVLDLAARARVAAVDVGQMAGGIAFWRTEDTKALRR